MKGKLGFTRWGGQFDVFVGKNVEKVFQELCTMAGLEQAATINENLDAAKEPLTLKKVGSNIMAYLSGSLTPIIPVVLAAAIFKSIVAVFGPDMLGILSTDSDLYTLFTFVGDAGYYFFPLLIGYTAAKKLNATPVMGIFMGAILLHPTFVSMATDGTAFSVYGIPCTPQNYSSTILPILLTVWVMSYVERFFKRYIPDALKIMLVPTLTTAVMLPIALCVCGPIGGFLGNYICAAVVWIGDHFGFVGAAVIGALWEFLVMTGMHYSLLPAYVNSLSMLGYETVIGPGNLPSNIAQGAAALCVAIKTKNKNFRQLAVSGGVTALLGVTEPALFGVNVRLRKPLIATTIGGGLGGLYAGLTGVRRFGGGGAGLAAIGLYVGENPMNVVNALISAAIAFIATFAILWFIGFDDVPEED